jgi:hypothetical protein
MCEPFGQRRPEQLATQLIAGQPDGLEHRQHFRRIIDAFRTRPFRRPAAQRPVQQPQGGFAMIPTRGAKLIENARFVRTTGALIAAVNADQRLAFVVGIKMLNLSKRAPQLNPRALEFVTV